jgi:transmembrane sensor
MQQQDIEALFDRYNEGKETEDDRQIMESWYLHRAGKYFSEYTLTERLEDADAVRDRLLKEIRPLKRVTLWPRIAAAAVFLLVIGAGVFTYLTQTTYRISSIEDVTPGKNAATLLLANGSKISLSDVAVGKLTEQDGALIEKTGNGELVYQSMGAAENKISYHTLMTANGEQYMLRLPDGTKVWLNAGTQLRFPASFKGLNNREVFLSGEAYFEVVKNRRQPFIVKSTGQRVQVLGTHFNINSYANEPNSKTALLEGSVRIQTFAKDGVTTADKLLLPGEQAIVSPSRIKIEEMIPGNAVAWKEGLFRFEKADIKMVMRQLQRWYDITVIYEGEVPQVSFSGNLHRNLNLSEALRVLEHLGIKFKLNERKLTIYK